jgi:hypothetical protein
VSRHARAHTIEVGGQFVAWTVTDEGLFECSVNGGTVHAKSLSELTEKARAAYSRNKVKIAIAACVLDRHDRDARNVELTGIHSRTRQVTIRDVKTGKADTIERFAVVYKPFSPDDETKYAQLIKARDEAERQLDRFLHARIMGARAGDVVSKALSKATGIEHEDD